MECPYCRATWSYYVGEPTICPSCGEIIEEKKMATTIPCSFHFTKDCPGCLTGYYNEVEKLWVFRCNECGIECGRG